MPDLPAHLLRLLEQQYPGWVCGAALPPPAPTLGLLLEHTAARVPDAEALVVVRTHGASSRWTYQELADEVRARAADLAAAGVRPGDVVGLVATRSAGLVPSMLATVRLGAAYLPLDPRAPAARWAELLGQARVSHVVGPVVPTVADRLPQGVRLVPVDAPVAAVPADREGADAPWGDSSATAYVLFTSGSTGVPKGVVVSHRSVLARAASYLALTEGPCRYLLHSSLCFDGAVGGLVSTIARGGCLVLPPDETAVDPGRAAEVVAAEAVTHLEPVPSWYAALLDLADHDRLRTVRAVILGGEVLPPALVDRHRAALPAARLFNDYGPTETTVAATVFEVTPAWCGDRVPIGRPHANTAVAVLDESGRPLGLGEVGRLWVGGPCVADGYLRRSGPQSFGVHPDSGAPAYDTGDLARWTSAGVLEFHGRADRQVKIRGQRVEPDEAEAVLAGLPGVAAAAVEVDTSGPEPRLVGFANPVPGRQLSGEDLRAALAGVLPGAACPVVVQVLDAMPLTAGGKVDRRALPSPAPTDAGRAVSEPEDRPRDDVEAAVIEAFAAVLGIATVGRRTSLLRAGGTSLGAARVAARLRGALQVDVGVADVVAAPDAASLADVLRARLAGEPALPPAPPLVRRDRPRGQVWRGPATPRQQSFWFLESVPGGRSGSNLVECLRLPRPVAPAAVRAAVEALTAAHSALRTSFLSTPQGLVQVVRPDTRVVVRVLGRADDDQVDRWAGELGREPFDLEAGPLLRVGHADGPQGSVLVLVVHHAVADGWSLTVLVEDLLVLLAETTGGADAAEAARAVPPAGIELLDHAEWLLEQPAERVERATQETLAVLARAASAGALLPYDRPVPAQLDPRAGLVRRRLPASLVAAVSALARRLDATPYHVLAATLGALLARITGVPAPVLAGPVSGRGEPALDRLVGCLINTGLFPVETEGDPTVGELVRRVAAEAAAGAARHWLPLEVPLRRSGLKDVEALPVLLNLLDTSAPLAFDGEPVRRDGSPAGIAYTDLDIYLEPDGDGLRLDAVHVLARLDAGTVEALVDRWLALLAAAVATPDLHVSELPVLTSEEQRWLDAREGHPGPVLEGTLPARVRELAAAAPHAPAVVDREGTWSRAELDLRARRLAAGLHRRGVREGDRVVITVDGQRDLVAALLGCWYGGAVPVPVGVHQPPARLQAVRDTVRADAVLDDLTVADLVAASPEPPPAPVDVAPDGTAYVVFTSGSTGTPKGVLVSHRALSASTAARERAYPDRPEVALIAHDAAFDAALGIIAWYLATGGVLVLAPYADRLDPQVLGTLIARHGVGQLDIVPSHYRLLLEHAGPGRLADLRLVTLGGEVCPPALVAASQALLPDVRLVNEYGPSECTVWALAHECGPADAVAITVPIGTPIAGVVARVAARDGSRVPVGAPGELLLGGHLLAEGYLGHGDAADRFVAVDGRRWYRTGDRVRWSRTGELEFLGRLDEQVKVRGYRIEPAEVEAALLALPEVVAAAAGTVPDPAGEPDLVAWVVPRTGSGLDVDAVRAALRTGLPDWLVPSALVVVDALPVGATGKVDRDRLPAPRFSAAPGEPPGTATEERVAAVWQDLLGRRVGVEESFFRAGGQSLLAARMVARLRAELETELDLSEVLTSPTIRSVAALVDARPGAVTRTAPRLPVQVDVADADTLLDHLSTLNDEQVEDLLAQLKDSA